MTSQTPTKTPRVFFCPTSNGDEDGTASRPFSSLTNAAMATDLNEHSEVELIRIDQPGAISNARQGRHEFYVDTHLMGRDGDGSERDPWPSFSNAITEINNLVDQGRIPWKSGEVIRVKKRQMFTASSLEKRKKRTEQLAHFITMSMALVLVIPVVLTLGYLLYRAWPALSLDFLFLNPKKGMTEGGIWAPLIGTFFLVVISLIVAAPIGILAGVYLNEYAKDNWMTRIINLAVVNLAGVPSIVHGLFGVGAFVAFANMGKSLLAASCTLAVMTLPVIIASTKEALGAVPVSFREACWNLGASRWQTIRTIVLPNSISGILTGVILQVARSAGETAPILFTGVAFSKIVADEGIGYYLPFGLGDKFMALSNHLFILAKQNQFVSDEIVYGTAVVLIGLVLMMNSLAIVARIYLRSRAKW